jgi:hypothetical protein
MEMAKGLFFYKSTRGVPTWIILMVAPSECLKYNFRYMCALHSVAKMEHHASAISLSFFGNLAFHGPSSDSHAASIVEQSSLNTVLFLLFQMCQQHNIMKVMKCLLGICSGDLISYSF